MSSEFSNVEDYASHIQQKLTQITQGLQAHPAQYIHFNLSSLLDLKVLETNLFKQFRKNETHPFLAWAEYLRNILVLVPIAATWLALYVATRSYVWCASVTLPDGKNLLDEPFLLLWQEGFKRCTLPETQAIWANTLKFSHIASLDFWILVIVIVLSIIVQYQRDIINQQAKRYTEHSFAQIQEQLWELELLQQQKRHDESRIMQQTMQNLLVYTQGHVKVSEEIRDEQRKLGDEIERRQKVATDSLIELVRDHTKNQDEWGRIVKQFGVIEQGLTSSLQLWNDYNQAILSVVQEVSKHTSTIKNSNQLLSKRIKVWSDAVEKNAANLEAISTAISGTSDRLTLLFDTLDTNNRQTVASLNTLNTTLDKLGEIQTTSVECLQTIQNSSEDLKMQARHLTRGAESYLENWEDMQRSIRESTQLVLNTQDTLQATPEHLTKIMDTQSAALEKLLKRTQTVTDAYFKRLVNASKIIGNNQKDISTQMEGFTTVVTNTGSQLQKVVTVLATDIYQLREIDSNLTEYLTELGITNDRLDTVAREIRINTRQQSWNPFIRPK